MRNPVKCAFTLIEMLVVVAIIMVLGTLLYPALGRARESGRMVRCNSNLRQLYFAAMNFSADGHTPSSSTYWYQGSDSSWYLRRGWIAWLECNTYPDDGPRASKPADGTYDWQNATVANQGTRCITNGSLWGYMKSIDVYVCPTHKMRTGSGKAARSYSMSAALSYINFFQARNTMQVMFGDDRNIQTTLDGQFATNEVAQWHTGKGNVVYLDGHVEQW
jgi:prepilin-type processing-associated H-X9-DG protein/prepilin-type N-terminal cleavage/methylation domain-containing protein